ncbi:MAG: aminopeptidase P family protein [Caldisericaceae bacterium]|nr:aminopeptidase P family protein [Caldisericaceae bacterium]
MLKRLDNLLEQFNGNNIDAFLITATPNIRYLTNFTGEDAFLLVANNKLFLIVDSRFTVQAEGEVFEKVKVLEYKAPFINYLKDILLKEKVHWLGVEKNRIMLDLYLSLSSLSFLKIVFLNNVVEDLRIVKDLQEVEKIKKACAISSKSFSETLAVIKEGITEIDIASELEYRFRRNGGLKPSFDTIVASGKRGALPHGLASNKKIFPHELIVMDFGVFFDGYASDTTRMVCVGEPTEEEKKVFEVVRKAQEIGRNFVCKGISASEVDIKVRKFIQNEGYGDYFIHGLGHGVGLEIHESPRLNTDSKTILDENMVITVEPGIYLPEKFGIRVEDTMLVGSESSVILTELPREIYIV